MSARDDQVVSGLPSDEVSALPEHVRKYIMWLETNADPAGTVRENFRLTEENAGLRAMIAERAAPLLTAASIQELVQERLPAGVRFKVEEAGVNDLIGRVQSAAQEAVAWINPDDLSEFERAVVCLNSVRNLSGNDRYTMPLYAAPVAAAPGIDLRSRVLRLADKWEKQAAEHGVRQFTGNDHLLFANELRVQIDASPKGDTFHNDGNSEAQFIADETRLNCPSCGGSGHVEDSPKGALHVAPDGFVLVPVEPTYSSN